MHIAGRLLGLDQPPVVIPEIGINHEGDLNKAFQMIEDAATAGAEVVKFQSHVIEDEMSTAAKSVIPGNATISIWDIMSRCAFSESQERELKIFAEKKGLRFLSTPFSRAAADRLERIGVEAYKIGSGECNNYPLIDHIARFGKPIIVSTGMNDIESIRKTVEILEKHRTPYALLHCTSMYPTPYSKVRLGALKIMQERFPNSILGLSDHSKGIFTCLAAIPLGARILEKHFTSDKNWPGPDIEISIDPHELKELILGSRAVFDALGGGKEILPEEKVTIDFAFASVVAIEPIKKGEILSKNNLWVKRPGTGQIRAEFFSDIIGKRANCDIPCDKLLEWKDVE